MTTITQKKLQLSEIEKDVTKRLKDFENHREQLKVLKNSNGAKPKPKGFLDKFLGL